VGEENAGYLATKRERLGHDIPLGSGRRSGTETA
jgi:hypothetical protein